MLTYIDGKSSIYGLLGEKISYTLSPLLWNIAFRYCKLNAVYIPIRVKFDCIERVFFTLPLIGIKGISITVPFKEEVAKFCTSLVCPADLIKAVNAVLFKESEIIGYNTDALALLEIFKNIGKLKVVLLIGAGGAGKAALWALANINCEKIIWTNRTYEKMYDVLKFDVRGLCPVKWGSNELIEEAKKLDLVVNATTLGWKSDDKIEWLEQILLNNKKAIFFDLNYNFNSPLQLLAKNQKVSIINGLDMLVRQASYAFKIFTGCEFPGKFVKYHLKKYLNAIKY